MNRKNRLFCLAVVCMTLLVATGISAYATNLCPDASFEGWAGRVGNNYPTGSDECFGSWRFYANSASGGSLDVVSDAHDGSVAMKLTRGATDGDMALGLWNTTDHHFKLADVEPGKRYIVRFWAKSDDSVGLKLSVSSFGNAEGADWIGDTLQVNPLTTHSKWSVYQTTYVAPAGAYHCQISFVPTSVGSVTVDDISIVEEDTVVGMNLFPDPYFSSLKTDETFTGETKVGSLRFFAGTGLGSLTAVDPGYDGDGDTAASFTCNVNGSGWAGGDMAIGLANQPSCPMNSAMPAIVGRTYRYTFYAKTAVGCTASESANLAEYVRTYCSAYSNYSTYVNGVSMWISDQNDGWEIPNDGAWHKCTKTYTPPANTLYVGYAFRQRRTGTLLLDNVSFKDVTPCTVSGIVASSFDGSPVNGATVTFTGDNTFTATTDATGAYSVSVEKGAYTMTVSATNYTTYTESNVSFSQATTKSASLMPNPVPDWNVYDTFTRDDNNTDLGHTEDSLAVPWVKNANGDASISNGKLYAGNSGSVSNGIFLGRGFTPADFDVTVDATMNEFDTSQWFGISYRENAMLVARDGYIVQVWPWGLNGNATPAVNLWCNDARIIPDQDVSQYLNLSYGAVNTLRLKVRGSVHTFWLNGHEVFSITDSSKTTGGYMGLFCDVNNIITWDNFNASYQQNVPPVPVNTIKDAEAQSDGTRVSVAETLVATVNSKVFSDNSYYIENVDRAYGIKIIHGQAVSEGSRVTGLMGTLGTDANGERYIDADTMTVNSGDPVGAMGMSNKAAVESLAQNLLVKVWGKVTTVASDKSYFYINDGSAISDGTGNVGIRVDYSTSTVKRIGAISTGEMVTVTGVLGFAKDGTTTIKVIRPKSSLDVNNATESTVTVSSADTSWVCQTASGAGTVAFTTAPDSKYGSGAVLMTEVADGSTSVINFRTNLHAGALLADLTELSISNYMTYFDTANTYARGVGARISLDLDGVLDTVEDIITCDPFYSTYSYSQCKLNSWVTFDALNDGLWYSTNGYAGSSDAGPYITLAAYLVEYPTARIASVSNGGLRFFMGGCQPHWNNVAGYVDNVRVGTLSGSTIYNFE